MGIFKAIKQGIRRGQYITASQKNDLLYEEILKLYMAGTYSDTYIFAGAGYLISEQLKYLMFNDMDDNDIAITAVVTSSCLITYFHHCLEKRGHANFDLEEFFNLNSGEVMTRLLKSDKYLKPSHADIYAHKMKDTLKNILTRNDLSRDEIGLTIWILKATNQPYDFHTFNNTTVLLEKYFEPLDKILDYKYNKE